MKYLTLVVLTVALTSICEAYPKAVEDVIIKNRNKNVVEALKAFRETSIKRNNTEVVKIVDNLLIKFADGETIYTIGLETPAKVYTKGGFEKLKEGNRMFDGATSTWGKIPEKLEGCEIRKADLEPGVNTLKFKVKSFGTVTVLADGSDRNMLAKDGWKIIATIKHGYVVNGPGNESWIMSKTFDVGTYELVGGINKAMVIRMVRF